MFLLFNYDSNELYYSVGGVDCGSIDHATILLVLVVVIT